MRLYVIAANDPKTAVEFNGQTPPLSWRPKVDARLVRIDYRPGRGAIIHVVVNGNGHGNAPAPRHNPTDIYDPDYGDATTAMPCAQFPPDSDAYAECWRLELFPS